MKQIELFIFLGYALLARKVQKLSQIKVWEVGERGRRKEPQEEQVEPQEEPEEPQQEP